MLIRFSKNPIFQIVGIILFNWFEILVIALISFVVYFIHHLMWVDNLSIPTMPVTILGGALAIFLAFRNNSAYDRWWEARKIWGGVVNYSRTFGRQITTLATLKHTQGLKDEEELHVYHTEMVNRHIAWMNALRLQLSGEDNWDLLRSYLVEEEFDSLMKKKNKATQLIQMQGKRISEAFDEGVFEDFRHMQIDNTLTEFYNLQGKAERINNTIFPFYYSYFTRLFLWLFLILLPFALVPDLGVWCIPISIAISIVFNILEKTGSVTEKPFHNEQTGMPMKALCRTIEIDMLEQLGETDLPEAIKPLKNRTGAVYLG